MEDILKALVSSRQQGNTTQGGGGQMANIVGGLMSGAKNVNLSDGVDAGDVMGMLGGFMSAQQSQPAGGGESAGGLGNMMGALEGIMGGNAQGGGSDPIMMMLQPFIAPLAKKANIPPEIAMMVVSFVAHKLLSHHPTSGRDSNSFNLEDMLGQVSAGGVDSSLLQKSGMVSELAKRTGLDEATAEKSLQYGFSIVGKGAAGLIANNSAPKKPAAAKPKTGAGKVGAAKKSGK